MAMVRSGIGDRPKRREDVRFLTGRGAYLDDLAFDGLAHAIVLRSPHAHARIDGIETQAAQAMPGVLAVLTAADARVRRAATAAADSRSQCPDRREIRVRDAAGAWPRTRFAMSASRWR